MNSKQFKHDYIYAHKKREARRNPRDFLSEQHMQRRISPADWHNKFFAKREKSRLRLNTEEAEETVLLEAVGKDSKIAKKKGLLNYAILQDNHELKLRLDRYEEA